MFTLSALTFNASLASPQEVSRSGDATTGVDWVGVAAERYGIPKSWRRAVIVLQRSLEGPGSIVVGDPCIVRDDDIDGWRMFLFFDPPGFGISYLLRKKYGYYNRLFVCFNRRLLPGKLCAPHDPDKKVAVGAHMGYVLFSGHARL
jgi:hypothetical protein